MSETPVPPIEEYPVPDPTLFLLNRANRDFVERRSNHPVLDKPATVAFRSGYLGIMVLMVVALLVLATLASSVGLLAVMTCILILIIVLGGLGALFWAYFQYMGRTRELKGWIIPGVVTHSEKIRIETYQQMQERLGIRFEFVTQGGVVEKGYTEGDSDSASDTMAPAPGTPVSVWYDEEGKHYLL